MIRFAVLAIFLLGTTTLAVDEARAQAIVKWTDESGHVHYSDHAPPGRTAVSGVSTVKSSGLSGSTSAAVPGNALDQQNQLGAAHDAEQAAEDAEHARKLQLEQQQQAAQAARKKADQAVIDRCMADHQINCSDGADAIRQRNHLAAEAQCTTPAGCRQVEQIWQQSQNSGNN